MKKVLTLLLVLSMLLALVPVTAAAADAPHLRTDEHITYINGVSPGKFSPGGTLTRAEAATMIARLLDTSERGETPSAFPDVADDAWYHDPVTLLASHNILRGYPDGRFGPSGSITRAEFVTILSRLFEPEAAGSSFPDVPAAHWAYEAVQTAMAKRWVSGYPDGTFRPDNKINRAEAVTVINNALGRSASAPATLALLQSGGVRCFYDVAPSAWYYAAVTEASVPHAFSYDTGAEVWTGYTYVDCGWPEGVQFIEGRGYHVNANKQFDTYAPGEIAIDGVMYRVLSDGTLKRLGADVRAIVNSMTLREKVCQLMVVWPEALTNAGGYVTGVSPQMAQALQTYPVGGVVFLAGNLVTPQQTLAFTSGLQNASARDLLICVDEEGGRVGRLMNTIGTTKLNSMYSYRHQGTGTAYANAAILSGDLKRYGFNTDFAPVADVWSNPANTVIGDRAYSDNYDEAATLVSAAVQGFRDSGVICTLKHFPGHGSTVTDSHYDFAVVNKTLPQLRQEDLKPFAAGIAAGADMVMTGHIIIPTIDYNTPTTYSYALTTTLLREEMGFEGVIITDALRMTGAGSLSQGEKAVRCVQAGADILLGLTELPESVAALEQAVQSGRITTAQLDAAVTRIIRMKVEHGIIPA